MSSPAAMEVAIRHCVGTLRLDAAFSAQGPWTVLFGASGSGKSTLLRAVAGLIRPAGSTVRLLGAEVSGLAPHRRPVRWCGQKTALFPNMDVRANLAYGWPGASAAELAEALEVFGLGELARARPAELSGGQQQRVAVARAAVGARGKVLLLDEPFSGLDRLARTATIHALRTWLGPEAQVLSVTHDVGEAFELRAEVVRLAAGRVLDQGPVAEVLRPERDAVMLRLGGSQS